MDTNKQFMVTQTPAALTVESLTSEIKQELTIQVNGFVRIGFLLKTARDTDVLSASSYKDVMDYASSEFGLTKDVVSRYIHICEKYSVGGNSDKLLPEYEPYGYSKLAEMLTLPDEIAEEITAQTTRQEIQEIKKEYREEQAVTPLERMAEKPISVPPLVEKQAKEVGLDAAAETLLGKVIYLICKENKWIFEGLTGAIGKEDERRRAWEALVPNEQALYTVRIPQTGKVLISAKDESVTITSMRSGEKEAHSIDEVMNAFEKLIETVGAWNDPAENLYTKLYGVAPVQQPKEEKIDVKSSENDNSEQKTSENDKKTEQTAAAEDKKKAENEKSENAESPILTGYDTASDFDEASKTGVTDPKNVIKPRSGGVQNDEKMEEMTPERLEETVRSLIRATGFDIYFGERKEKAEEVAKNAVSAIYHIREMKWKVAQSAAIELAEAAGRLAEIEDEMFFGDEE